MVIKALEKLIHFGLPLFILWSLSGHYSPFFYGSGAIGIIAYSVFLRYRATQQKCPYDAVTSFLPFVVALAYIDAVWNLYYLGDLRITIDATHGYIPQSQMSAFDLGFWFLGAKSFVTPLIFKVSNGNLAAINGFFVIGYIATTLCLIATLPAFFKDFTEKIFVFYLFILLFLNQTLIGVWLTVAQSEAPAIMLTVLMMSVYAFAYQQRDVLSRGGKKVYWLMPLILLTTFFYSFARDTNMYSLPFWAVFYFLAFTKPKHRATIVVAFASIFILHNRTMETAGRWKSPLANVLMQRIIPNHNLRQLFQDQYHLPGDEIVKSAAGKWASSEFVNKELLFAIGGDNSDWVSRYGLSSYRSYLIGHPGRVTWEWIGHWSFYNQGYWRLGLRSGGRYRLNNVIFSFPGEVSFVFAVVGLAVGLVFLKRNPLISLAMLHSFVIGFVAYHGDAMEVERHFQQASMTMRVSFLIVIVLLYEVVKDHVRSNTRLP